MTTAVQFEYYFLHILYIVAHFVGQMLFTMWEWVYFFRMRQQALRC